MLAQVNAKRPVLQERIQRDTDVFAGVIEARRARDRAKNAKMRRKQADRARRRLGIATDIAVRIANECVSVGKLGLVMVEIGYVAAKGDPACGVSNAIAEAQSAIWIALLNIRKSRGTRAREVYAELESAFYEMTQVQTALLGVVTGLRRDVGVDLSAIATFLAPLSHSAELCWSAFAPASARRSGS